MLYCFWDMACDGCNYYFSFWDIFCQKIKKSKILKKWKKHLEISSSYTRVPKIMIICSTALELWCMTDVIVIFPFGVFFALLTPPCHPCAPKLWSDDVQYLRYGAQQADRQKKWDRGGYSNQKNQNQLEALNSNCYKGKHKILKKTFNLGQMYIYHINAIKILIKVKAQQKLLVKTEQ